MKSTQAMRDRIRERSTISDDYDRAVLCILDDLEALQPSAAELAVKIDEALALVPQSADGVEVAAGDMLMLGPEISDLLREIAGLPPFVR
jgi:hypothetical protein